MYSTGSDAEVLPLDDITVIDLTQVLAGPFATMNLGDLGAEVIKIEPVGRGDRARGFQPVPEYFDATNRNKRSISLDLKRSEGQEVAHRLLADADVFIESTKHGRAETFDLDYPTVRELNPEIIYCSVKGFGRESPYEGLPAWDMLIQAMSGIMSMAGEESGPPVWSGLPSGDLAASSYAAQSVLAALYAREQGAIDGEWIEVPMMDAAISWLSIRAGHSFGSDEPFPRTGTHHPSVTPFGVFECEDERMVIAAGTDSLWKRFCDAIDRPELKDDPRFATLPDRQSNRETLLDELERELRSRPVAEWIERCHAHDVPAGPIYDTISVWDDPHVKQRELHRKMPREGREDADVIDHPVHFLHLASQLADAPPDLGEDTEGVLEDVGYSPEHIERLRSEDVVD